MILSGTDLYGTTYSGGTNGTGSIFKFDFSGNKLIQLFSFAPRSTNFLSLTNINGLNPTTPLTLLGGTLYGACSFGGPTGSGTVFKINTDGSGFALLAGTNGNVTATGSYLYITFAQGGINGFGTIERTDLSGNNPQVLHHFAGAEGGAPGSSVVLDNGKLYGTTSGGSTVPWGTIYSLTPEGSNYTTLHVFSYADGAFPNSRLFISGHTAYGATSTGGQGRAGTIYALPLQPTLKYQRLNSALILSWDDPGWELESAPSASGPYIKLPGALSPYTNNFANPGQFFRLRGM